MTQSLPRDDGFEVTFSLAVSRDDAWKRLSTATPFSERLPQPTEGQWWLPGWEDAVDVLEIEEGRRLVGRKANMPCQDTEIVIQFEDEASGSRITLVQYNFGDGFTERKAWLTAGWTAIHSDFAAYLQYGVSLGRHLKPWNGIGCDFTETPAGLVVARVQPDAAAERIGLEPGDLVVSIAASPVATIYEWAVLMRGPVRPGYELHVSYLRDSEVHKGKATV